MIKQLERIKTLLLGKNAQTIGVTKQDKMYVLNEVNEIEDIAKPNPDVIREASLDECIEQIALIKEKKDRFKALLDKMKDLKEKMPTETEKDFDELGQINRNIEKLNTNILHLKFTLQGYDLRKLSLEGFRKKELEHMLKEYACEKTTFWKFSQSKEGIAGEAGVFAEYSPGHIVESMDKDCGLSFVRANDLFKCWRYGDQITKFVFDLNDQKFNEIADKPAYETGNNLGEIKTDYLLPDKNYSLSQPETILLIIQLSEEKAEKAVITIFNNQDFKEQMERFGFDATVAFIDYVNQHSCNKSGLWISENINDLYNGYIKSVNFG